MENTMSSMAIFSIKTSKAAEERSQMEFGVRFKSTVEV
jgi:hypothetical protein